MPPIGIKIVLVAIPLVTEILAGVIAVIGLVGFTVVTEPLVVTAPQVIV
jgi:hypothetical protein